MSYRTRKDQVDDMVQEVQKGKIAIEGAMRDACFVGGCEERERCLEIIDEATNLLDWNGWKALKDAIRSKSVLDVLGYEPLPRPKKKTK